MKSSINVQRRRFLLGGAALAGVGTLAGLTRWFPVSAMAGDSMPLGGPVTLVIFDQYGQRLGMRNVARVVKSAAQWRAALSAAQFRILRQGGTERAFSGKYVDLPEQAGIYRCQGCDNALYDSATQFHSGTGWPSFWQPIAAVNVSERRDVGFGMVRTEIRCARCNGHLGHKFHDGPKPTGLRYCMNSVALRFAPNGKAA